MTSPFSQFIRALSAGHFAAIFVSVVFRENRGVINARRAKEKSDLSCMSVMQDSPDMVDERL